MFKGIGKKVVVLKNTESDIFEEAIFIIKEGTNINKKDLLKECETIINKNKLKSSFINKNRLEKPAKILIMGLIVTLSIFSILLLLNLV